MSIGQVIAEQRKQGLMQAKLAHQLGVNQSIIARWESGQVRPRAKMLGQLAQALDTSVDDLLCLEHSPQAQQNRPALKEMLQQLPQLADYQIEALKVVVSDTPTRSQMKSLLKR